MSKYSVLLAFSIGIFLSTFSRILDYDMKNERYFNSGYVVCGKVQSFKRVSTYHRLVRMSTKGKLTIINQVGDTVSYYVAGGAEKAMSRLSSLEARYLCLTLVSVNGFYEPTFIKDISIEGFSMVNKEDIRKEYFLNLGLFYYFILLVSISGASYSAYKLTSRD